MKKPAMTSSATYNYRAACAKAAAYAEHWNGLCAARTRANCTEKTAQLLSRTTKKIYLPTVV